MATGEERAAKVRAVLAGLDYAEEAQRLGLHRATLYDLAKGNKPGLVTLNRFIDGFGLNREEWLDLYGHLKSDEMSTEFLLHKVAERSQELTYDRDLSDLGISAFNGVDEADISPDIKAKLEAMARALLSEERRKQGRE